MYNTFKIKTWQKKFVQQNLNKFLINLFIGTILNKLENKCYKTMHFEITKEWEYLYIHNIIILYLVIKINVNEKSIRILLLLSSLLLLIYDTITLMIHNDLFQKGEEFKM